MLHTLLLLFNAVVAVALVIAILLQRQDSSGGGIMGGANLGASPVVRNPLAKPTAVLATLFMGTCLLLAVLSMGKGHVDSVFDNVEVTEPTVQEQADDLLESLSGNAMAPADDAMIPVPAPESVSTTEVVQ